MNVWQSVRSLVGKLEEMFVPKPSVGEAIQLLEHHESCLRNPAYDFPQRVELDGINWLDRQFETIWNFEVATKGYSMVPMWWIGSMYIPSYYLRCQQCGAEIAVLNKELKTDEQSAN